MHRGRRVGLRHQAGEHGTPAVPDTRVAGQITPARMHDEAHMPIYAESANRIPSRKLAEDYWEILREYLEEPGAVLLNRGYEFSRRALADGRSVVEMAAAHHQAMRRQFEKQPAAHDRLQAAEDFFAACLVPFETRHRDAREGARALHQQNENLEAELKRFAHALHDEAGQLLASVHMAVAEIAGDAGVRLPGAVETALYRIVQEAVNNAVKHAHAHSVRIELKRSPSKVACSVRDDGSGFDMRRRTDGLGLIGIRERLNALGGSLHVVSESRRGTTLLTDIPLGG